MNTLSQILSSKVRAGIFRTLFGLNAEEIHMREIERRTGFAIGTIQTELKKLLKLDLVEKRRDGNRLYYRANRGNPLYPDIRGLVLKTVGLVDTLAEALTRNRKIKIAFVFGSVANSREKAGSDVGLVLIGDTGLRETAKMLFGAAERIGREINPVVFTKREFSERLKTGDHFVARIIEEPKIFIIGSEDDLAAMA